MTSNLRPFFLWLLPAVVVTAAVARVSVWVQPHFAPLVLFPLLIGAALGALFCGLLQLARLNDPLLAVAGAVILAVLAAAAEHAFFYFDYRVAHARKALDAGILDETFSPADFSTYMRAQGATDGRQVTLWIGNAAAMVVAAAGVVIWYTKSHHVVASLRDANASLRHGESSIGETRPRDANGTEAS